MGESQHKGSGRAWGDQRKIVLIKTTLIGGYYGECIHLMLGISLESTSMSLVMPPCNGGSGGQNGHLL